MDIKRHIAKFEAYTNARLNESGDDDFPIRLKIEHTMNVLEHARNIVESERPSPDIGRAALLAALYHDLGRFRQYLLYRTFRDSASCNHGFMGAREVKAEKYLEDETPATAKLVLAAIALHNRGALPKKLPPAALFATNVVRDADKIDILRVIHGQLSASGRPHKAVIQSLPEDESLYSQKTIDDVLAGRPPAYDDLLSINDFRLMLGSWFYEMHFEESRRRFIECDHARQMLLQLPDNAIYGPARNKLLTAIEAGR